ncbi:MAG TPA: stage III sporulation protein AD, partial [Ruminococcaceae bacterium]|nr:stage III sporulation protein AD [Oscillospiraceae bacterium]
MNIVGIAGIALVSAVIAVMLRRYNQEYAVVVTITAGVIILVQILANIMPAIRQINSLLSSAGLPNEYAVILFKTLGLCFLA